MKKLFVLFFLSFSVVLMDCNSSKKEGCQDENALNFDAGAEKDDGSCLYARAIFYATSRNVGGTGMLLTKIEVFLNTGVSGADRELIGTITTFDQQDPQNCVAPVGAIEYQFSSAQIGSTPKFFTRYFFEGGTEDEGDSIDLSPTNSTECLPVRLTLP